VRLADFLREDNCTAKRQRHRLSTIHTDSHVYDIDDECITMVAIIIYQYDKWGKVAVLWHKIVGLGLAPTISSHETATLRTNECILLCLGRITSDKSLIMTVLLAFGCPLRTRHRNLHNRLLSVAFHEQCRSIIHIIWTVRWFSR